MNLCKSLCKRTQQVTALVAIVGTCCVVHVSERKKCQHCWWSFKEAMHSGTVVLAMNMRQHFRCRQHCCGSVQTGGFVRSQNNRNVGTCCAKSLTGFKLYTTSANIVVVTCKRMQYVGPNNVACCRSTMLGVRLHGP